MVREIDALSSEEAGIDGPGARSDHGQPGAQNRQLELAPGIAVSRKYAPEPNHRRDPAGDWCPQTGR